MDIEGRINSLKNRVDAAHTEMLKKQAAYEEQVAASQRALDKLAEMGYNGEDIEAELEREEQKITAYLDEAEKQMDQAEALLRGETDV